MIRFPPLTDDILDAEQQRMATMAQHIGPYQAFLRAPSLWQALQVVRIYLARQSSLDDYTREALMLAIARHWTSTAGFTAHTSLAQKAGLSDADIASIGRGDAPEGGGEIAGCAVELAITLLANHHLSDARFATAHHLLGEKMMVDIIGLIGFFSTICLTLNLSGIHGNAPFTTGGNDYSPADKIPVAASRNPPSM